MMPQHQAAVTFSARLSAAQMVIRLGIPEVLQLDPGDAPARIDPGFRHDPGERQIVDPTPTAQQAKHRLAAME
jgi:hypothetical protein